MRTTYYLVPAAAVAVAALVVYAQLPNLKGPPPTTATAPPEVPRLALPPVPADEQLIMPAMPVKHTGTGLPRPPVSAPELPAIPPVPVAHTVPAEAVAIAPPAVPPPVSVPEVPAPVPPTAPATPPPLPVPAPPEMPPVPPPEKPPVVTPPAPPALPPLPVPTETPAVPPTPAVPVPLPVPPAVPAPPTNPVDPAPTEPLTPTPALPPTPKPEEVIVPPLPTPKPVEAPPTPTPPAPVLPKPVEAPPVPPLPTPMEAIVPPTLPVPPVDVPPAPVPTPPKPVEVPPAAVTPPKPVEALKPVEAPPAAPLVPLPVPTPKPPEALTPPPTPKPVPAPVLQPPVQPAPTPTAVATPTNDPPEVLVRSGKYVVLKDDKLVEGSVAMRGDVALVRHGALDTPYSKNHIQYVAESKDEVYRFMRAKVPETDIPGRLKVARWCMFSGMREQALAEAREVQKLDPKSGAAADLVRSLELSLQQYPPENAPKMTAPEKPAYPSELRGTPSPTLPVVEPEAEVTPEGANTFATRVQPFLANQCVECHAKPDHAGAFKLARVTVTEASQQATRTNLRAVAGQLRKDEPMSSPLLLKALGAHGGQKLASVASRQAVAYQTLEAWAALAVGTPVMGSPAVPVAPPAAVVDPVLPPVVAPVAAPVVPVIPPAVDPVLPPAVPPIPPADPLIPKPAVPPIPPAIGSAPLPLPPVQPASGTQFGTTLPPKPPVSGPTGGDEFDPSGFNKGQK